MTALLAIGIDPGPATGIFLLDADGDHSAYQCNGRRARWLLGAILAGLAPVREDLTGVPCGIEGFRRGAKQLKGQYPDVTRALVTELTEVAEAWGLVVTVRAAAEVKPWAEMGQRLERAGITQVTGHGMAHARDAGKHALFTAVHAGVLPDPLSRKWPLQAAVRDA